MSIFKACDIRGIYPDEIDERVSHDIGRAVASKLGGGNVVVGGDVRLSTACLKRAVIEGLTRSGASVMDIGIVPTPVFYFARKHLRIDAGVMVTASHNPAEHNGLKIILGKLPITEEEMANLRRLTESREFTDGAGNCRRIDVGQAYESFIVDSSASLVPTELPRPSVVLDCGHGCYSEIAPRVLKRLGVPHVPLFCSANGAFPGRGPNSSIEANLGKLRELVIKNKADLGVAFDGDGDRVSFVDERGEFVSQDKVIAIIARHHLGGIVPGDKVILDIKCSRAVADSVRELGGMSLVEKSGHTFIKTRVIRENAALGGEMSGHLFYRELEGGDDGLYSALAMIGIVASHGPLSALAAAVPSYVTTPEIRLRLPDGVDVFSPIAQAFPPERVNRLDGVLVEFPNGWALARLSVTEPIVTLRFEAEDQTSLSEIMASFLAPVPLLRDALCKQHPNLCQNP